MVLPVAGLYWLFGPSEFSACLYPLACSVLTIFLAYLLAKDLFGWQVAVGAALILALFPLDIVYSTQLVPTVPLACALAASLLVFVKGDRLCFAEGRRSRLTGAALLFVSGIFLGAGWLVNEPAPLFAVVIALYPVLKKRVSACHLLFLAGALSVFLAECCVLKSLTGDLLWRLKIIHDSELSVDTRTELSHYAVTFYKLFDIQFAYEEGHFGLFWYLFVPGSVFLLAVRERRSFFLLAGVWLLLLYLQFGVMTVTARPIAKAVRYLEMLLPFAAILTSLALAQFGETGRLKRKGWALLILLLLSDLWFIPRAVEANRSFTRPLRLVADFFRQRPADKPIYADKGAVDLLSVYLGQRDYRPVDGSHFEAVQDAFVLINGSEDAVNKRLTPFAQPETGQSPPPGWRLLRRINPPWQTRQGSFHPLIYYVPEQPVEAAGRDVQDPKGDVTRFLDSPEVETDLLDMVSASVGTTPDVLRLEMGLARAPEDVCPKHTQIIYLWALDLDSNGRTGQKHGPIGSELNVRLSNERGSWQLFVDDIDPSDGYGFAAAPTWFGIEKERIRVRLPARALTGLGDFNWRAEAVARTIASPQRVLSYDCLPENQE
jgi:hypothetical protein